MSETEVTAADIRNAAYGLIIPAGADDAIDKLIAKATERIYRAFPTLDDRIARGEITADLAKGVIEDMVIRVLRNPNAYRQISIDDYIRMIDTALSSGALYLSDDERNLLAPRTHRPRARSIRLAIPRWRLPGV